MKITSYVVRNPKMQHFILIHSDCIIETKSHSRAVSEDSYNKLTMIKFCILFVDFFRFEDVKNASAKEVYKLGLNGSSWDTGVHFSDSVRSKPWLPQNWLSRTE